MVEAMGESAGVDVTVRVFTGNNLALEDHWKADSALAAIRTGGPWNAVVMQQGPSGQPAGRAELARWAARFGQEIRAVGAVPVLYMVWPDASRLTAYDSVSASYRAAAAAAGGVVAPAGEAWTAARERNRALPLYARDMFHPSVAGSYLAALTISAVIFDLPPTAFPGRIQIPERIVDISPVITRIMHDAVGAALVAARPD
jgi:hypothetical protein